MKKILIITGGTGGHVIPARVLYDYLKKKENVKVDIACDSRGTKYLNESPAYSWNSYHKNFFIRMFYIFLGFFKSMFIIPKYDVVISFGTYFSVPFILNAIIFRKKLLFHEQNILLSRVNELLSSWGTLMVTWPIEYKKKEIYVGMPIRKFMEKPLEQFKILIVFGSQEAPGLKDLLIKILEQIPKAIQKKITIITSPNNLNEINLPINIEYFNTQFGDSIMDLYNDCSMAIGRGGAGFLYEMMAMKKPTITLPLHNSVNNHQYYNSKYMEDSKLGILIWDEKDIHKVKEFFKQTFYNFEKNLKINENYVPLDSCEQIWKLINN